MSRRAFEKLRRFGTLCGAALLALLAVPAFAEPVTVAEPLMRYGLGTLGCAAYSPNPDAQAISIATGKLPNLPAAKPPG